MIKRLTIKELTDICNKHDYILLRDLSGGLTGHNTKIAKIAKRKKKYDDNAKTDFIAYRPCSINEYITYKIAFYEAN